MKMSHPDPCYDPENSYEDDDMVWHDDTVDYNYGDHNDFYADNMDGDHDSAMTSCGWGTDEDYGGYQDDIDSFHDYYGDDV
ncbi:MAG: hypothetical protein EBZ87_03165 [Microbacteriaceae bacterium]|nr:hypothetical protein [Microbacteriaceae bacterium]